MAPWGINSHVKDGSHIHKACELIFLKDTYAKKFINTTIIRDIYAKEAEEIPGTTFKEGQNIPLGRQRKHPRSGRISAELKQGEEFQRWRRYDFLEAAA